MKKHQYPYRWRDIYVAPLYHWLGVKLDLNRDKLSGLPNRAVLILKLRQSLRSMGLPNQQPKTLALVCLDLDKFKSFNDTYGHEQGNELLREFGQRLRDELGPLDFAARMSRGDEFAILLPNVGDKPEALERAFSILAKIDGVYDLSTGPYSLGVSMGVRWTDAPIDLTLMLQQADKAMYDAKRMYETLKRRVVFHSDDHWQAQAQR